MSEVYLTLDQVRKKLGGRARGSIYLDIENGRLPEPIKLGRRIYWPESELDEFLLSLTRGVAKRK